MKKQIFKSRTFYFILAVIVLFIITVPSWHGEDNPPSFMQEPTGVVESYAGTTAPEGYLMCDGAAVSRTTYVNLFNIISTTFGAGNGTTTFNVPDMRGRFPFGVAASGTGNALAATFGTIDHLHTADPPNTTTGVPSATIATTNLTGTGPTATHTHDVNIASFNTGTANPPALALNFIIKI